MTLKRSRSDVAKITPATANWRVPSSSVGAEIIGTGSSEDTESRSSPESRALLLRSLPVWSLNSSIGSGGGFGEIDRLDPTGDLHGRTRLNRRPSRLRKVLGVTG
ncbi:hypothetical protein CEP51_006379 [Fusarium floridanum]|uniref:Uncharacterized protein n=2 Tax=Fusarium solani species complex TaxID=232080 RepID=A0A428RT55_9HYPO|nr:hypothetical protein CEP51_006379 [Fusarium floridanum]RSL97400.1 hypothetical protein CDV31_013039 [Fusarium ambrosium]